MPRGRRATAAGLAKTPWSVFQIAASALAQHAQTGQSVRVADEVKELDLGFVPNAGAPSPMLWAAAEGTLLLFYGQRTGEPGTRQRVAIQIEGCQLSKFGYPNDEALPGHPLYNHGLSFCGVFEVLDSSWLRQVREMNKVTFPNPRPATGSPTRHFIITFQDETFECLATGMAASLAPDSLGEALRPFVPKRW